MEKLPMCRICLVDNVRMYVVVNKNLHELYEKLTNVPFVTKDRRPMLACFFCCTKLKQCCCFLRKCLEAEEMFTQMMNETDPLINPEHLVFFNGFVNSPIEHISIDDGGQTENVAIKEELPVEWERHDNIVDPEEEHRTDELELKDSDVKDTPAHHSESDSEDLPIMEIKTKVEDEQEYIESQLESVDNSYYLKDTLAHHSESDFEDDEPLMEIKIEVEDEQEPIEMPRNRAENRKVGGHTHEQMRDALQAIKDGQSIRQAAVYHKIPFSTLQRYQNKLKETQDQLPRLTPNYAANQVYSNEQELILKDYFTKFADLFYGLSVSGCRQVAYEMAKLNGIKIPTKWTENQLAGLDWLRSFRQRHPEFTLRKPEARSLARASDFDRETVNKFYDHLENVIKRHPAFSDGTRIYNLDETSTTTVQNIQRIMALKGRRNHCKVTSDEKATLVTTCNIISAAGQTVPPVLIFPTKNANPLMAAATPPGSLILANPTGWLNSKLFLNVMKHFIRRTGSSKEHPSILIMDNHESHLSIEALGLAKESGVTLLILHPHISARLQPLDVGIPFKTYYYSAMSSWMLRNPGCLVTIYDVGALIGEAFAKSMTPLNITQAFKRTGIFPFDRHIFSVQDFAPNTVTDCSENIQPEVVSSIEPAIPDQEQSLELVNNSLHLQTPDSPIPTASTDTAEETRKRTLSLSLLEIMGDTECPASAPMPVFKTPEKSASNGPSGVSPLPLDCTARKSAVIRPTTVPIITTDHFQKPTKAPAKPGKRKPRKLGSLIATDTPEKNAISEQKSTKRKRNQI